MRNTITLNGIESSEIPGLLIQELPPISKPLMRTEIEEIDGRDGDIITPLGFSAYDKDIVIGLYGDFDIDEVISYFTSSGTVIFSNEPEKYYNYQIINQIDFERLLRFRTATVTLHVQPFKYSTEEKGKSLNINLLNIGDFTKTTNNVTLTVSDGVVTISGTPSAAAEFYVPVTGLNVAPGDYTLSATSSGTNASKCAIRLIGAAPSNADSFGGNYVTLADSGTVQIQATQATAKTYGYLWFYANAGAAIDCTVIPEFTSDSTTSFNVTNSGNYFSRPQLTLYGSGTINLSLNGNQLFVINLGETPTNITIDSAAMEAYQGTPATLMNRYVDGDYNNFKLNVGKSTITWSGNLTKLVINNYSRWI
jgi:phage-related protein